MGHRGWVTIMTAGNQRHEVLHARQEYKKVGGRDARWTKMGRQDARQKEWGEEVRDEKKWGDEM